MSGKSIGKALGSAFKAIGLGNEKPRKGKNEQTPEQIAQQEADKKQQMINTGLARKKNRSVLSTGAASMDSGATPTAKRLLGE